MERKWKKGSVPQRENFTNSSGSSKLALCCASGKQVIYQMFQIVCKI